MLTSDNYQLFVNYICSDLKRYLPIYWKLFTTEILKHTSYKLEHLRMEINDDHIYFLHDGGSIETYFQFIAITSRNTCHDKPEDRFKEWCLPTNYDLPTLFEGELTQKLNFKLPHLTDMNYVKTYIDTHIRDQKLDGVLNEDKSCTKCDSSGIVYDKKGNDKYCEDCGGLKMVLPGIKMIKMIRQ